QEEYGCNCHHDEYHGGRNGCFPARRPGHLQSLGPHLFEKLQGSRFRHWLAPQTAIFTQPEGAKSETRGGGASVCLEHGPGPGGPVASGLEYVAGAGGLRDPAKNAIVRGGLSMHNRPCGPDPVAVTAPSPGNLIGWPAPTHRWQSRRPRSTNTSS